MKLRAYGDEKTRDVTDTIVRVCRERGYCPSVIGWSDDAVCVMRGYPYSTCDDCWAFARRFAEWQERPMYSAPR